MRTIDPTIPADVIRELLAEALDRIDALSDPRPKHQHVCPAGKAGNHTWFCSSPYCEPPFVAICDDHGGLPMPTEQRQGGPAIGRRS